MEFSFIFCIFVPITSVTYIREDSASLMVHVWMDHTHSSFPYLCTAILTHCRSSYGFINDKILNKINYMKYTLLEMPSLVSGLLELYLEIEGSEGIKTLYFLHREFMMVAVLTPNPLALSHYLFWTLCTSPRKQQNCHKILSKEKCKCISLGKTRGIQKEGLKSFNTSRGNFQRDISHLQIDMDFN